MKKNWVRLWLPLGTSLILMVLFIFSAPVYSSAGDGSIAKYLSMAGADPGFNSISVGIGAILKLFYRLFPAVNWWTCFSIWAIFSSIFIIMLSVSFSFGGYKGLVPALMAGLITWQAAPAIEINFTQTAMLLGTAGISLLMTLWHFAAGYVRIAAAAVGMLYILLAGSLREDAMLLCIPFAGLILFLRLLSLLYTARLDKGAAQSDSKDLHGLDNPLRPICSGRGLYYMIVPFCTLLIAVILSYGSHRLYKAADPDIAFFEETFDLTREVYDYQERYPDYEDMKEGLDAAGLTGSWYGMVQNYYIIDSSHFTPETLGVAASYRGPSHAGFESFISVLADHKAVILLLVLLFAASVLIFGFATPIISLMISLMVLAASGFFFVYLDRFVWRVIGGVVILCMVLFLQLIAYWRELRKNVGGVNLAGYRIYISLAILILAISVAGVTTVRSHHFELPIAKVTAADRAELLDHIDSNKDILYVAPDMYYSCHNVWSSPAPDYLSNKLSDSAGYNLGRGRDLLARGIGSTDDIVINMITRPDIYSEYGNVWIGYLCDYYNPYVSASIVDELPGTDAFWVSYMAPVEAPQEEPDRGDITDLVMNVETARETDSYQVIGVSCRISDADAGNSYYLNVENPATGAIYSYQLVREDDILRGGMIWRKNTWSLTDCRMYIVEKRPDISVKIADITGAPIGYE
ncbi:hypothetical protein [Butyrivibrio sp. MC2013]|uniref:hypothetical protein n=1 Tax=Butyrivibrio sp. MC2013 TaxID=1280686 RepID=UPI00047CCEDC|nr:hypothetical protein [Butyrivibrio sp. MC2013]